MCKLTPWTVRVSIITLLLASHAYADAPQLMNYQGTIDSADSGVTGTYQMVFTIYDAATGGTDIWTETQPGVSVQGGLFNVLLGSVDPLADAVFDDTVRYLGVQVATDPEMTPRTRIVTVGYAHRVSTVDGASGGTISGDVNIQSNLTVSGEVDAPGVESKIRFHYNDLVDLPDPSTYHGMFAHVHNEGQAYYAHAGAWVPLADSLHSHPGTTPSGWVDDGTIVRLETDSDSVGIGTPSPLASLHVRTADISLPSDAVTSDVFVLEDLDALLGLYSNWQGSAGSGIVLGEISNAGAYVDKWGIVRETNGVGSGLRFTYGSD